MRYIQWRRSLQLHVCISILGSFALVHTAYILCPCNSMYEREVSRLFSDNVNPSLQINGHVLLGILQRNLACRPSILPIFCRSSANFRNPRVDIREGSYTDLPSYPIFTIEFSWPGAFLNSLLLDCLSISCMGCRYSSPGNRR